MFEAFVLRKFSALWHGSARLRNYLLRNYIAKWKLWSLVAVFLGLVLVGLAVFAPRLERNLDPSKIALVSDVNEPLYAYPLEERVSFPWQIRRDNPDRDETSDVKLFMAGKPLNHNPDYYYVIELVEPGYYAHSAYKGFQSKLNLSSRSGLILFTTPDWSDPRNAAVDYQYSIKPSINYYLQFTLILGLVLSLFPIFNSKIVTFIDKKTANINQKNLFMSISALALIPILTIIITAFNMRPSRDDYWITSQFIEFGFWGFQYYYWSEWIGSYFGVLIMTLTLLLPTVYLPWHLSSAFTFMTSLILLSLGLMLTIKLFFKLSRLQSLVVFLLSGLSWWVFVWTRDSIDKPLTDSGLQAYSLISWQNINAGYIIPIALMFIIASHLIGCKFKNKFFGPVLAIVLGMITGSNTYAFSSTVVFFIVLFLIFNKYYRFSAVSSQLTNLKFFFISHVFNFMILVTAPGNFKRYKLLNEANSTASTKTIAQILDFIFVLPIKFLFDNFFSLGSLLVLSLSLILGFILSSRFIRDSLTYLFNTILVLLLFIIVLNHVTYLGDLFSYGAFWHTTNIVPLIYTLLFLTGLWSGTHLAIHFSTVDFRSLQYLSLFLLLIYSSYITYRVNVIINKNHQLWVDGYDIGVYRSPVTWLKNKQQYYEVKKDYWIEFTNRVPGKVIRY